MRFRETRGLKEWAKERSLATGTGGGRRAGRTAANEVQPEVHPTRLCQCGHVHRDHGGAVGAVGAVNACLCCRCLAFRPRVFASHRQLTGAAYIHHAYVYDGNKVVRACAHKHGLRTHRGGIEARACADRMLRKYLREIGQ